MIMIFKIKGVVECETSNAERTKGNSFVLLLLLFRAVVPLVVTVGLSSFDFL